MPTTPDPSHDPPVSDERWGRDVVTSTPLVPGWPVDPAVQTVSAGAPAGYGGQHGRGSNGKRFGPLAGGLALLAKFGNAALLLLKGSKFLGTAVSMAVSIGAYTLLFGWPFAVGFVLLILVHEMGHWFQLRREGIPGGAPVFIPFLGALIAMRDAPKDAAMEARVGLAGPVLGSVGAVAVLVAGVWLDSDLLRALGYTGAFLNLFNLLPVSPLDGGRAAAALSPRMWFVGLALLVGLLVYSFNPVLLIILVFGAFEVRSRWKRRGQDAAYYRVPRGQRIAIASTYVGLVAALVVVMDVAKVAT